MRPKGTPLELEQRRRRAIQLLSEGCGVRQVARIVGASAGSVTVWRQTVERSGSSALAAREHPGRRSKLTEQQRRQLPHLLETTARRMNCDVKELSLARIVQLIERIFGVRYDPSSVWHILRKLRANPVQAASMAHEFALARLATPIAMADFRPVGGEVCDHDGVGQAACITTQIIDNKEVTTHSPSQ